MGLPSILLAGLAALTAAPAAVQQDGDAPTRSLEELLDEARRARARAEAELRPVVAEIMDGLDTSVARRPTARTDAAKRELMQLGVAALPLIVPYLDPGESTENGPRLRAQIASEVLHERPSIGVTSALLDEATAGTSAARRGALFALRTTPEPRRVLPSIVAIVRSAEKAPDEDGEEKARAAVLVSCYRTIAALGQPGSTAFLSEEIASGNPDRQRLAIRALEYGPTDAVVGQVIAVLRSNAAAGLAEPIVSFLGRRDALLQQEDLAEALIDLGLQPGLLPEDRIGVFDLVRITDAEMSTAAKRKLEKDFGDASSSDLRRAALLLLARNKDRSAKRELLEPFEEQIAAGGRMVAIAYRNRAELNHAIGEWSAAVKDWRSAMKASRAQRLRGDEGREQVGIAKSLARIKKYREAAEYLKDSPLTLRELQELGRDRDFREMRGTKWGQVFRL
ncbi:MAG: hypothetical protein VX460_02605 [Planctomycetota bacterium]|nr:hypothetical protein [Planctomycetota bacterium]